MGVFSKIILFCNNEIYEKVKAMINSLLYCFEKVTWPAGFFLIFFFFIFQLKKLLIELDNLALSLSRQIHQNRQVHQAN